MKILLASMLLLVVPATFAQPRSAPLQTRVQRLLHIPQDKPPLMPEVLNKSVDGELELEDVRFRADRGLWIPAIVAKPVGATKPLPAIICLPGTSGTRQHLTDANLKLSPFPRTGWARALAREGFVTISIDYRGSDARQQDIYLEAVREQLAGRSYMGLLVYEVMRAVDYLQTRADVDRTRIGVTGFSLGGAMAWYAAAADPRLRVVVPVCGGAGTYDALTRYRRQTSYHSQYFYPAGFLQTFPGDQPDLFAALAPRPVLVVGRDQDQGMPVEGLRKLEKEVSTVYAQRGAAGRFAVHITPGDHNYSEEMFAQVKQWFTRFLKQESKS
ncbi:MAG TPA: alpha/beta hydrolase family protein [Blastocatellia bacterium]|nr:alpha/beta hydrolase family protein [Blastocatellia bacterium]